MFHGLFEDEDPAPCKPSESTTSVSKRFPKPAFPRGATRLSGLSNLGATCYLNSLLQTLHYTPEFREALFSLSDVELGVLSDAEDSDVTKVRVIPIQLQHLFARLLMLDKASADVTSLTDSFGWTNNEELQQHDVQELNRILFSAIESSLLGTAGEHLISKLYHGATVQQITCQVCGRVSEREEEFLDLPVALSGHSGLEETLNEAYIKLETLEAPNQYFCGSCQKLVDAKRGCHIRKLPSILTFALLRFLYDFKKGERYKDTSRFKFPMTLDMAPYCEAGVVKGDSIYELFSVVIHSGSTHSGHYTAFIRDVEDLGVWSYPEDVPVKLPVDDGTVDVMDCENPADLLAALLGKLGGTASVSKLCKFLQDQTGVTWNKRFKKQFGPIVKFMKSCTDIFEFSDTNYISLKSTTTTPPKLSTTGGPPAPSGKPSTIPSDEPPTFPGGSLTPNKPSGSMSADASPMAIGGEMGTDTDSNKSLNEATEKALRLNVSMDSTADVSMSSPDKRCVQESSTREEGMLDVGGGERHRPQGKPLPPSGQRWFEFNDAEVSPICSQAIEKMFQGKKSAYMLFYRKKSLPRPAEAKEFPSFCVPEQLVAKIATENSHLDEERCAYETSINTVRLHLHYHSHYHYDNGALHRTKDIEPCIVNIDKRKTMQDLKELISESYPNLMQVGGGCAVLHTARFLPAGMHLYDLVSDKDEASLAALDMIDESHLFVWDGVSVGGEAVEVGECCEPVQLHVMYPSLGGEGEGSVSETEMVLGFSKNSTLREIKVTLSSLLEVQPNQVTLSQVKVQERRGQTQSSVVVLSSAKDKSTLAQLSLSDGDKLTVERELRKGVQTLAHSVADKHNKMLSFIVEDRCTSSHDPSSPYPVFPLELVKDELVITLKKKVLSKINAEGVVRFRVETDVSGLGPPLYEQETLAEAGIDQGQRVVVEPGEPPTDTQVFLQCKSVHSKWCEVILDKQTTIGECCSAMAMALGFTGDCWHLRKTDWSGEEADILEDETVTLEKEKLKSGAILILEEGKLPPKGYIRPAIFLFTPDQQSSFQQPVMMSQGLPSSMSKDSSSCSSDRSSSQSALEQTADHKTTPPSMDSFGSETSLCLLSPSQFYPPVPGEILEVGSVEVSKDLTLHDLKLHILTLPAFEKVSVMSIGSLRLRELVNGRLGKIFKQGSHTLRRLKLTSATQICCQVLDSEEELPTSAVVFNVCMRDPHRRQYGPLKEVVYDVEGSPKASSPHSLRSHLSQLLDIPLDKLRLAKHKVEAFQWISIESSYESESKRSRRKGHGSGSSKANIKNSPIMLRDGDIIGFKDLRLCDADDKDFTTVADDQGKAVLLAIQEDKRKRRKAKEDCDLFGPKEKRQRRPERGIKIYVPDYGSKL